MKKVLTIAVVALLATATLFAGVNFSGRFRQGYVFAFEKDKDAVVSAKYPDEGKLVLKVSDDNALWTINFKSASKLDSGDALSANATFDLTKALALGGIDTGDFSLAISIGANSKMTALSAYNDVTGNEYYKLKNNGSESMQLAMAYGKLAQFNVAFDPTTTDNGSIILSAKSEPINGVAVAAAYGYNGWFEDAFVSARKADYEDSTTKVTGQDVVFKNAIGFSADINVAKLVGLDFNLGVAAYDNIGIGVTSTATETTGGTSVTTSYYTEDATVNSFAATVYGGVDFIDAFAELTMMNMMAKDQDTQSRFGLNMQVNLNVVENLGLDVYYNILNFKKAADNFAVGGDVSYNLAGVEFALNAEYKRAMGDDDFAVSKPNEGTFSLTPKMTILF